MYGALEISIWCDEGCKELLFADMEILLLSRFICVADWSVIIVIAVAIAVDVAVVGVVVVVIFFAV